MANPPTSEPRLDERALDAAHRRCEELCACRDVLGYGGASIVHAVIAAYVAALPAVPPSGGNDVDKHRLDAFISGLGLHLQMCGGQGTPEAWVELGQLARRVLLTSRFHPAPPDKEWTPDQPLRVDATRDQIADRMQHLYTHAKTLAEATAPWYAVAMVVEVQNALTAQRPAVPEKPQEAVASLRTQWLRDVETLHVLASRLEGKTVAVDGFPATVYDVAKSLRGIADTLTARVTNETDPRSGHFIEVLTDILAELHIPRDSTKGSLAQQVAHELRIAHNAHPVSPALVGDEARRHRTFNVGNAEGVREVLGRMFEDARNDLPTCDYIATVCEQALVPALVGDEEPYRCRHCGLPINAHSEGRVRECLGALSSAPRQAIDDIGVDDGATDGYAVSVNRSAPRLAEVEEAMTDYRLACIARGAIGGTDTILAEMESTHARLLALLGPAGGAGETREEGTFYGKDCPVGMVQVEFVGVDPRLRYSAYGWKPSKSAFLELSVDGQRFRVDIGNVQKGDGTTRRGLHVNGPLNLDVDHHSVNAVDLCIPTPSAPREDR